MIIWVFPAHFSISQCDKPCLLHAMTRVMSGLVFITDITLVGSLACVGPNMNGESRVGAEDFSTVLTAVLHTSATAGLAVRLRARVVRTEVRQVVGQDSLAGAVQNSLGFLLEQLQSVDWFVH